jgi:hypothetical protein
MVSNAFDYGVLGLSPEIKVEPSEVIQYFYEREERVKKLTDKDFIKISIQWIPYASERCLTLEVEDSGAGYNKNIFLSES